MAKRHANGYMPSEPDRAGSEPVDAALLSKALKSVEDSNSHSRQRTPVGSPSRKRQRIYGDRLVNASFILGNPTLD